MDLSNVMGKIDEKKPAVREYLFVVILAVLCLAILRLTTPMIMPDAPDFWNKFTDPPNYIENANETFSNHHAPFAWRVLVPTIVHFSGLDFITGFYCQTMIFLFLSAVIIYAILRTLKHNCYYSASGMVFFLSIFYISRFNLSDFYTVDPATYFFISLAILLILRESNDFLIIITLCAGVLAKESVVFVLPLYYFLKARKIIDWDRAIRFVIVAIPVIYFFLLPRICIYAQYKEANYVDLLLPRLEVHFSRLISFFWEFYLIKPFGVFLVVLPFFAIAKNKDYLIRTLIYFILVLSQLPLAVATGRMLSFAFPVLIPMSVVGLETLVTRFNGDGRWALGFSMATFAIFIIFVQEDRTMGLIEVSAYIILFIGFIVALYRNRQIKNSKTIKS